MMKRKYMIQQSAVIAALAAILTVIPMVRVGSQSLYTAAPVLLILSIMEGISRSTADKIAVVCAGLRKENRPKAMRRVLWLSFSYGLIFAGIFAVLLIAAGAILGDFVLYHTSSAADLHCLKMGFYLAGLQVLLNHVLYTYLAMDLGNEKFTDYTLSFLLKELLTILLRILILFVISGMGNLENLWWIHLASLISTAVLLVYYYLRFKELPQSHAKVKGDQRLRKQILRIHLSAVRDLIISDGWLLLDAFLFCFLVQWSGSDAAESHRLMGVIFWPCLILAQIPFVIASLTSLSRMDALQEHFTMNRPKRFQKEFLSLCRQVLFYILPFGFFVLFHSNAVWTAFFGYEEYALFGQMIQYAGLFGMLYTMNSILHLLMRKMKLQPYYSAYEIVALVVKAVVLFALLKHYHASAFLFSWLSYESILLFLCMTKVSLDVKMDYTKLFVDIVKIVIGCFAMHGAVLALGYVKGIDGLSEEVFTSLWQLGLMMAAGILVYLITCDVLAVKRKGSAV